MKHAVESSARGLLRVALLSLFLLVPAPVLAEAQYLTGVAHADGRGTEVTTWKAREFLERAIAGSSENAVKHLSSLR